MTTESITRCDHCSKDLTVTTNCIDYRLTLTPERIPSVSGPVTAMLIHPPIDSDKHFCSIVCLQNWLMQSYPQIQ